MNWISWFGLGIVLLLLIPKQKHATAPRKPHPRLG